MLTALLLGVGVAERPVGSKIKEHRSLTVANTVDGEGLKAGKLETAVAKCSSSDPGATPCPAMSTDLHDMLRLLICSDMNISSTIIRSADYRAMRRYCSLSVGTVAMIHE